MSSEGSVMTVVSDGAAVPRESVKPAANTNTRIDAVDGLRACAMLLVFSYHVWMFSGSPALGVGSFRLDRALENGPIGVDFFMVLSGFCLFWPLAAKPESISKWTVKDYAMRRVRRIVPPYYAAIAFMTVLPFAIRLLWVMAGKTASMPKVDSAWQYVTHLTFTHTLFLSTWSGIQGAFWSLGLEAQFYVVFPLVIWAYRRMGISVVAWMVAASVVYRCIVDVFVPRDPWEPRFLWSITFLGRWMQFGGGMLAAWIVGKKVREKNIGSAGMGAAYLLGAMVILWAALFTPATDMRYVPVKDLLLTAGFGAIIVATCATATPLRWVVSNRAMAWLGAISYSVFLIHQNTVYYVSEFFRKVVPTNGSVRFALLMTVGLGIVMMISYPFHRLFERPFMTAKARSQFVPHHGADAGSLPHRANESKELHVRV